MKAPRSAVSLLLLLIAVSATSGCTDSAVSESAEPKKGLVRLSVGSDAAEYCYDGIVYIRFNGGTTGDWGSVKINKHTLAPESCRHLQEAPPDVSPGEVACTQEAMQCPDGRFVGRSGPDCRFDCGDHDAGVTHSPPATSSHGADCGDEQAGDVCSK